MAKITKKREIEWLLYKWADGFKVKTDGDTKKELLKNTDGVYNKLLKQLNLRRDIIKRQILTLDIE